MRKNLGVKPYSYPQPVYIICAKGSDGNISAMNAAWGGIRESNEIALCLSNTHKTVKNILESKAFTISPATKKYTTECDYLGVVSGNDVSNKLEVCHFTTTQSEYVNAPIINELPIAIECELKEYTEDGIMIGIIKNVSVDESVLTNNKVDIKKVEPISFDPFNNQYVVLTEVVGNAFKDGLKLK